MSPSVRAGALPELPPFGREPGPDDGAPGDTEMSAELIVLSDERWTDPWHRTHHIVSRLSRTRHTWFVERPRLGSVERLQVVTRHDGCFARMSLETPCASTGLDAADPANAQRQLRDLVGPPNGDRAIWMSTPLAFDVATGLDATVVVYDVMDHRLAPGHGPPDVAAAHQAALKGADVVFTAGPALHRRVIEQGRADAHLVPNGVDAEHFAVARQQRTRHERPVAGYVGPIDHRIDLDLVAALATHLPAWDIRLVGALDGVDGAALPRAPNLVHVGPPSYAELPAVMAGMDVAIMPLAVDATIRAPGPVDALEYLAAGLPVVSTPVPDVVTQLGTIVDVQDQSWAFAGACVAALRQSARRRHHRIAPLLRRRHWDAIVAEIEEIVGDAGRRPRLQDLLT